MAKSAGVISINLSAGTAQFVADMEKANLSVKAFGSNARQLGGHFSEMGTHGVSGVQAVSGALRVLEGGITNNLRAAERFTANVLGLGPLLQAAFPVIGAIAFAGIVAKVGEEVSKFITTLRDAPEKMRGTFNELNSSLRLTNDQLDVSNARLENEIAKLEGKRQNTLRVALDEARVAADKLADSLDKDLEKLQKVLEENKSTLGQQLFGRISDKGLREEIGGKTGFGGFRADIRQITESGRSEIDLAARDKDQAQVDAAILRLKNRLAQAYQAMLAQIDKQIAAATVPEPVFTGKQSLNEMANLRAKYANSLPFLEELRSVRSSIAEEAATAPKQIENVQLTQKKTDLEANKENTSLSKPLDDRLAKLRADLAAANVALNAAGLGEAGRKIAKAEGDALQAISEVSRALKERGVTLKDSEAAEIRSLTVKTATTAVETEWRVKLANATTEIRDQIRGQELLTAAIGKGYEAVKAANVEIELMSKVGPDAYNDPTKRFAVNVLRGQIAAANEAKHTNQVGQTVDKLGDQIALETRLAQVQSQGAEAVRLATLQVRLAKMQQDGATKEQIAAEMELYRVSRTNENASALATVNERIAAVKRLTAAQVEGADAVRRAEVVNAQEALRRSGATQPQIDAVAQASEAARENRISEMVSRRINLYSQHLRDIEEEAAFLRSIQKTESNRLDIIRASRDLENERLHVLSEQALALGTARDGVRAFFLEMQADGKKAAQTVYEALNNAFEGISANFAKLATGQRTAWKQLFQGIGEDVIKDQTKTQLQRVVRDIGTHFPGLGGVAGPLGTVLAGKPDGTSANPIWVRMSGSPGGVIPSAIPGSGGGADLSSISPAIIKNLLPGGSSGHAVQIGEINVYGGDPEVNKHSVLSGILEGMRQAIGVSVQANSDRGRRVPAGQ